MNTKDKKMRKLLETLAETMNDISALWDENEDYSEIMSKYYPESLMSFDDLTADISDWVEKTTWEMKKQ